MSPCIPFPLHSPARSANFASAEVSLASFFLSSAFLSSALTMIPTAAIKITRKGKSLLFIGHLKGLEEVDRCWTRNSLSVGAIGDDNPRSGTDVIVASVIARRSVLSARMRRMYSRANSEIDGTRRADDKPALYAGVLAE